MRGDPRYLDKTDSALARIERAERAISRQRDSISSINEELGALAERQRGFRRRVDRVRAFMVVLAVGSCFWMGVALLWLATGGR